MHLVTCFHILKMMCH